ncbi:MAG: calcium-binding protein [Cyanobacteria bacterium P01_G01_bin.39]
MSIINGTIYNDSLIGTSVDDDIFGDFGNDTLNGLGGDDLLDGYTGNDSLFGGTGDDILLGYTGNDSLLGGAGSDVIAGEAGDDILNGYGNTNWEYDTLSGGYGADTFILGNVFGAFYEQAGFATVIDFESAAGDKLQVFGKSDDYSLLEFDNGTDIYYQDDLIGYVSNTIDITLEDDFIFV